MRALDRVLDLRSRAQLPVAALFGALGALGQAPANVWAATVFSLALVFGLMRAAPGWRRAGLLAWAAGTGYFMLALCWIVEPFFVDAARHAWMAPFALFFLALGLGLFWGMAVALARIAGGGALALIAGFILAEALRTYLLTGFPWAQLGHAWINAPMLFWASWAGSLGLTALIVAAGAGLWHLSARNWAAGLPLFLVPLALYASAPMMPPDASPTADAPIVRLIQPNAPQHEKWLPEKALGFYERQLEFTAAAPEGGKPDLFVWPETAIPWVLSRARPALDAISKAAGGTPVVLGLQRLDGPRYYNTLITLDGAGAVSAVYDKHHLVPFGEYMPLGNQLAKFGIYGLAANEGAGYSAGPGPQLIDLGRIGTALPLICYEGVFPANVATYPERPRVLLLITNDAWFGDFSGPYQHIAQARLRSVEQGLPMIRVANTGVSAMIDANGKMTAQLGLGQAGWVDAPLPRALPPTIYARTGDWPMIGLALLLLALGGFFTPSRGGRHRAA